MVCKIQNIFCLAFLQKLASSWTRRQLRGLHAEMLMGVTPPCHRLRALRLLQPTKASPARPPTPTASRRASWSPHCPAPRGDQTHCLTRVGGSQKRWKGISSAPMCGSAVLSLGLCPAQLFDWEA